MPNAQTTTLIILAVVAAALAFVVLTHRPITGGTLDVPQIERQPLAPDWVK